MRLPVFGERKMLQVVTIKDPKSGNAAGFIPRTPLFGATGAAFRYIAVPRALPTLAVRRIKISRLEYFGDLGIVTTMQTIQDALAACTAMNGMLGSEPEMGESRWGA